MSSVTNTEQRKALRNEMLEELYSRLYSSAEGLWVISREDMDHDIERKRAFEYLAGKGYATIERERHGNVDYLVKLTASGVDKFESKA